MRQCRKCRKSYTLHLGRDHIEWHFPKLTPKTLTERESIPEPSVE